jgi:hypothetical protein
MDSSRPETILSAVEHNNHYYLPISTMSSSSFPSVMQSQIAAAAKTALTEMGHIDIADEFIAAMLTILFPDADQAPTTMPPTEVSDTESTGSKRGRKKGAMTPEAKAAMVEKRKATLAAKAVPAGAPAPAPADAPQEPKKSAEDAKKARSEAAKARYAALTPEQKEANQARLAAGKAAKKAAAAATA